MYESSSSHPAIPRAKGIYILVLSLTERQTIVVGKLGNLTFPPGYYLYVGSAFGAGGLAGRLRHHLKPRKLHWHIDYLHAVAQLEAIWFSQDGQRSECQWATMLFNLPQLSCFHRGFGSSDCNCVAHLYYCATEEGLAVVHQTLQQKGMNAVGRLGIPSPD